VGSSDGGFPGRGFPGKAAVPGRRQAFTGMSGLPFMLPACLAWPRTCGASG